MSIIGRCFGGIFAIALASTSSTAHAGTLLDELDKNFNSIATSCLGNKFNSGKLQERTVQGKKIRTAIPDEILKWDTINRYLFEPVDFDDDGALDLEFAKVQEHVGGTYRQVGTPLDLFWSRSDRPLIGQWDDYVVRGHNCITLVKGTSSFKVDAGFLGAAADASVDSQRAMATIAYAGKFLSPYAWATGKLGTDSSTARPPHPRVSYLLRIWEWYVNNPSALNKQLIISTEITGIALITLKEVTQQTMMRTQSRAGFGLGPWSASAEAQAGIRSDIQSQVVDFGSALLNREAVANLPGPELLAQMIRDEMRLSPSEDNVVSVGADPIRYVATLPYITERLCKQSAWTNASAGGFTTANFSVERTASGGCQFTLALEPPAIPSESLWLDFVIESPVTAATGSSGLKFSLPRTNFSDNRLLISFDTRPPNGITLAPPPLVDGHNYDLEFVVSERGGARLGEVQNSASRATIACGNLPPRNLPIYSVAAETNANIKLLRLKTRIDAGLLNAIEQGKVVECSVTAAVYAERRGAGAGLATFNLPTTRFVVRKDGPTPNPS